MPADPSRQVAVDEAVEKRELQLREGRTLTLGETGSDELVEIRGSSGALELRIRLTEEGPILEMESVRLSLRAAESVDVDCKAFNVATKADMHLDAQGEVHVTGEMIYLN